jgi:hypothetical protein
LPSARGPQAGSFADAPVDSDWAQIFFVMVGCWWSLSAYPTSLETPARAGPPLLLNHGGDAERSGAVRLMAGW